LQVKRADPRGKISEIVGEILVKYIQGYVSRVEKQKIMLPKKTITGLEIYYGC